MENNVHESEENMKTQDGIVFILNWFLLFKFKYHLTDDWLFVIDSYTNHVCSYCGFASTFYAHNYLFRGGSRGGRDFSHEIPKYFRSAQFF